MFAHLVIEKIPWWVCMIWPDMKPRAIITIITIESIVFQ